MRMRLSYHYSICTVSVGLVKWVHMSGLGQFIWPVNPLRVNSEITFLVKTVRPFDPNTINLNNGLPQYNLFDLFILASCVGVTWPVSPKHENNGFLKLALKTWSKGHLLMLMVMLWSVFPFDKSFCLCCWWSYYL
jgi:hypothetical protein